MGMASFGFGDIATFKTAKIFLCDHGLYIVHGIEMPNNFALQNCSNIFHAIKLMRCSCPSSLAQ